jgi:hypothetical protein
MAMIIFLLYKSGDMPQRLRRENGKEWHAISQSFQGSEFMKKVTNWFVKGLLNLVNRCKPPVPRLTLHSSV